MWMDEDRGEWRSCFEVSVMIVVQAGLKQVPLSVVRASPVIYCRSISCNWNPILTGKVVKGVEARVEGLHIYD